MSAAQILWDNWNKYDDLDDVIRQGYLKAKIYGYGNEALPMIYRYHVESVLLHSGRATMLLSDIMDLWPTYYENVDKYAVLKTMLNHDIGELAVGDIPDDGREEHDEKKDLEWETTLEHYQNFPEEIYLACKNIHQEFERADTFLGQTIKLADKLDFVAKLIKLESQGYNMEDNRIQFSKNDLMLARETKTRNFTDIVANHLRHLMKEHNFDQRLVEIAIQFLDCELKSMDRPFFKWWKVVRPRYRRPG